MSRISQSQLESYLWGAAEHLRGSIDAGDYKQFIFPLLFLKRLCDVHDEETTQALRASGGDAEFAAFAENHRFQVPPEAHWKEIRKETRNVGQAIQRAMRAIESANNDKLFGIFGDAQWTNKDRLSDETMRELVEHFSSLELTIANLPEDELGNGYEFLIKKFADDSGHTAAEFYTNRTVVHLMTEMLDVQPGESVYDPTCGSGGMLMSCVAHLRKQGKEWRNVRLFGQERNLMTSSIARMNCFLHGIEDFRIERGDTLAEPKLVEGDKLMQFDVVLANPPYSIKQWDREAFRSDPWGRNLFGVPPQGRADYAFQQHIIKSLKSKTGRSVALWPHGVLFRKEEDDIRQKLIESDLIEAVIGLGHNLFYNSAMQSCLLVVRTNKEKSRKGKILFIDASNEVTDERAQSFLSTSNRDKILKAYLGFEEISGFSSIATIDQVRGLNHNLNIPLYVRPAGAVREGAQTSMDSLSQALEDWRSTSLESKIALGKAVPGLARTTPETLIIPSGIPKWIDKNQWTRVKLGEVCEEVSERIDNPSGGPALRFVGLEHLDSGELKVRRWGTTENLESAMKVFKSGDILFARRNAYLKRASLVDFDGVCSGDAIVLRENHKKLAPGFLAFVLNADKFWEFAVANAAGTMSRRVNGKTLANYEFDLPPLDQQRRIAEMLWSIDKVVSKNTATDAALLKTLNVRLNGIFANPSNPKATLASICSIKHGWAFPGEYFNSKGDGPRLLTPGNITLDGVLSFVPRNTKYYAGEYPAQYDLSLEDLVVVMTDLTPGARLLGMPACVTESGILHNQRVGLVSVIDHKISKKLCYYLLLSDYVRKQIRKTASGTTVRHTSPGRILECTFHMPSDNEQRMFLNLFEKIEAARNESKRLTAHSHTLLKQMIMAILSNDVHRI